ncbi:uncharacterized protein KY384_006994 [Bacidia gigantensis]|uniref:uncharacterized protein n=1 Tax=Bacidia gigantensis TaxID=2732470 RepID=UPI001D037C26|nr:uncharacterized protein KY384_006994 [Bacidia gigantensis]KAG8528078.1 hypothetical protein KY384_006994 [Bacidia gigantensis]
MQFSKIRFHNVSEKAQNRVVFSRHAGQGVQRVGMAAPWVEAFPQTCRPFLDELDTHMGFSLSKLIAEGPNSTLIATPNAQPAIMGTSVMILRVLEQEYGFKTSEKVDVCLGHSLGEFAALVAAQHLQYADAVKLLRKRAEQMARCSVEASKESDGAEYGMVALVCEPNRLGSLMDAINEFLGYAASEGGEYDLTSNTAPIDQVLVGNVNSKNQIVLSGNIGKINALLVQLRQFGGHDPRHVRLATDSPFHSPIMAPAARFMEEALQRMDVTFPGAFPVISNVSARPFGSAASLRALLSRQCVETVRWWDSIRYLDQEQGVRRWIGLGPGKVGRNLVGKEVDLPVANENTSDKPGQKRTSWKEVRIPHRTSRLYAPQQFITLDPTTDYTPPIHTFDYRSSCFLRQDLQQHWLCEVRTSFQPLPLRTNQYLDSKTLICTPSSPCWSISIHILLILQITSHIYRSHTVTECARTATQRHRQAAARSAITKSREERRGNAICPVRSINLPI